MKKLVRIIPNLIIKDNYLVKGKQFKNHKYVGDIFNAVKIYSEKKVHEIQLLDISSRKNNKCIDIDLIKKIRSEIYVPLAVGGGINNIKQVSELINEGVEKVIINTSSFNSNLVEQISKKFGSQSVVVSIDVKKNSENIYEIFSDNGNTMQNKNLLNHIKFVQNQGAGEILLTSIDREGTKEGFDKDLYEYVESTVTVPLIANGGIKNIEEIINFFDNFSFNSVSCGNLFVYFGLREAVLINYPDQNEIEEIMKKYE